MDRNRSRSSIYLSPIIFNNLDFTAEQIGSGITVSAFTGIATRFGTGYFLEKKYCYTNAIKLACLIAIISDLNLFYSYSYFAYLFGQFFLGAAAGIYWPSVEMESQKTSIAISTLVKDMHLREVLTQLVLL